MRQFTLRFFVAVVAFTVGVMASLVWVFDYTSEPLENTLRPVYDSSREVNQAKQSASEEEYIVYSSVLADKRYESELYLIQDDAVDYFPLPDFDVISNLHLDTIYNYQNTNIYTLSLENRFAVNAKIRILSQREHGEIFRLFRQGKNGWKKINRIYPGARGTLALSRVGFNQDKTQALVRVTLFGETNCGKIAPDVCMDNNFLFLEKKDGRWIIKDRISSPAF